MNKNLNRYKMEQNKITLMEKYFPQKWEDIKLPNNIRQLLTEMQNQVGYRLMMYGSAGLGKTSTARLMVSDTDKFETLYLSGSNDFTIDVLRNKVMQFASGFSVTGKQKTCIIDECENIRDNIQDTFKIILDQCKKVNFIFITNEIEKVNAALRSRCTCIEYDFAGADMKEQQKNYVKYILEICKAENIKHDADGVKYLYNKLFPDFRHLLVTLQQLIDSEQSLTVDTLKKMSDNGKQDEELYKMVMDLSITGKILYEQLSKRKGKERECFISLGEPFFEYLNDQEKYDKTLQVAVIVSKYSDMFASSINKFVTFLGCINELRSIFR